MNKKSFILYNDLINIVRKLPMEKKGLLFETILEFVNGNQHQITDDVVDIAFESIKQQLIRDAELWEIKRERRSNAGKKGVQAKLSNAKQNEAMLSNAKQSLAIQAVNVNVNDNDNVTVTVTDNDNDIKKEDNKPPIPPKIHDSKKEDINTVLTELLSNNNFTEQENEKIHEWLQHKKEQKKAYKPQGLKSLIAEIRNQKEKGCNICEAIQLSVSNQWQGILYEKGYTKQLYQKPADKHQAIRDALHNCNDQDFTGDAEELWMRRAKRNMSS
jgi:hypothetical protein